MAGRHPLPAVQVTTRQPQPGLVEVVLQNTGEGEYSEPLSVRLEWKQALASGGLDGSGVAETVSDNRLGTTESTQRDVRRKLNLL